MAGRTITTNRNIRSIQPLHRQTRFILPNPPLHPESPLGWLGIEPTSLVFPLAVVNKITAALVHPLSSAVNNKIESIIYSDIDQH